MSGRAGDNTNSRNCNNYGNYENLFDSKEQKEHRKMYNCRRPIAEQMHEKGRHLSNAFLALSYFVFIKMCHYFPTYRYLPGLFFSEWEVTLTSASDA